MNQTQKLLQSIVENARMGEDACRQLFDRTEDLNLREELNREKRDYENAAAQAEGMLERMGVNPRPKGPMARMGMWMGMQFNTMTERSTSHIAELLIQGCTMGVVEITKVRSTCPDADADAQGVASGLITCQQEAIERLKSFLGAKVMVE